MIRWWIAYFAFLYAAAVVLNVILREFSGIHGLWLIPVDLGLGTFIALCMHLLRVKKRILR